MKRKLDYHLLNFLLLCQPCRNNMCTVLHTTVETFMKTVQDEKCAKSEGTVSFSAGSGVCTV